MANQRTNNRIGLAYKRILLYRLCMAFVASRTEKAYVEAINDYHNKNYDVTATNYFHNAPMPMGMGAGSGITTAINQLFSYDSSGNVVSLDYSTNGGSTFNTYYYIRNAQNDVVKLINGSGTTVVEYTYDTWGKLLSTTGSLASTLGANQPFRYRGYIYDAETGWYYLQSRYYDPSIGRFISADVLLSTGQGVLGHNAFAYCLNDPINLIDIGGSRPSHFSNMMTDSGGSSSGNLGFASYAMGGRVFDTMDEAAMYCAEVLHDISSVENHEFGACIMSNTINYSINGERIEKTWYFIAGGVFTNADTNKVEVQTDLSKYYNQGFKLEAYIHSHTKEGVYPYNFSRGDAYVLHYGNISGLYMYMVDPQGLVYKMDSAFASNFIEPYENNGNPAPEFISTRDMRRFLIGTITGTIGITDGRGFYYGI